MWLLLAFTSALLLGLYDASKKQAVKDNAVIPILFLNTLFSSIIVLPFILLSSAGEFKETSLYVPAPVWSELKYILLKAALVLSSWVFGYFGMKNLPITLVGPINATRPVMVLIGAMLLFGERLNLYQWIGVLLAIFSFFLLSRSGKKEGIDFTHNKWIVFVVLSALLGAISGLYDKYLMGRMGAMQVQSWCSIFQCALMGAVMLLLWYPRRKHTTPFHWSPAILLVSLFLSAADFVYFSALAYDGSMVSIVSMVRRSSVIVSFVCGAIFFHEKNLKSKAIDLILIIIGMFFLYLGTK